VAQMILLLCHFATLQLCNYVSLTRCHSATSPRPTTPHYAIRTHRSSVPKVGGLP